MEKNTLIAVVLSVVLITVSFVLQGVFFPADKTEAVSQEITQTVDSTQNGQVQGESTQQFMEPAAPTSASGDIVAVPFQSDYVSESLITYQNEIMQVQIDPRGGRVVSIKLLKYQDGDKQLEMIMANPDGRAAFDLSFGNADQAVIRDLFVQRDTGKENVVELYRDFMPVDGQPFRVIRRYVFAADEYMFKVETELVNSVNELIPLQKDNASYTLHFGPQIGPEFEALDNRTDFRRFGYYDEKHRTEKLDQGEYAVLDERPRWAGINGKYFAAVAVPGTAEYRIRFDTRFQSAMPENHAFSLTRPPVRSAKNVDTVMFYVGPKINEELKRYDSAADNAFGVSGLDLGELQDSRILGWFEKILKRLLDAIYSVIPNYGVAIIIMTILVKLALWPLTKKSFESNAKSQALQPKIAELRTKYKDNPEKLNAEMMAIYKKEGVNPLGGCLPLLLQMPLLLAMFGLFNNDFDLRGATFISGWISDLSAPESILYFGDKFAIPFLGWTDIRLLPILFVGSQLLFGRFNQPAGAEANPQTKMLTTFMPLMFFFILYNMPSGLLLYWIITNILSVVQQLGTTKYRQGHPQHVKNQEKKNK